MKKIYIIFCAIFLSTPAYAYLDPGFGSMLIQALIAFFAIIFTTASVYWTKIKSFFSNFIKNSKKKDKSYSDQNENK